MAEDAESEATARAVVEAGAEAEGELVLTMSGLTTMTREEEVASEPETSLVHFLMFLMIYLGT